jgi:hypothetical protein
VFNEKQGKGERINLGVGQVVKVRKPIDCAVVLRENTVGNVNEV